jgi:hypothetical protein
MGRPQWSTTSDPTVDEISRALGRFVRSIQEILDRSMGDADSGTYDPQGGPTHGFADQLDALLMCHFDTLA